MKHLQCSFKVSTLSLDKNKSKIDIRNGQLYIYTVIFHRYSVE